MTKHGFVRNGLFLGLIFGAGVFASAEEIPEFVLTQAESVAPESAPATPSEAASSLNPSAMTQSNSPFSSAGRSQSFSSGLRRPSSRLYDAPNMFGDLFSPAGQVTFLSNTQVQFFDPTGTATLDQSFLNAVQQQLSQDANQQALSQTTPATLDPAVLNAVQQQLSNDATMQARAEVTRLQSEGEGFINPDDIFVTVTLPDLTSAIVQGSQNFDINVVLPDLSDAIIEPSPRLVVISVQGSLDLQLAGGTRRTKIMENNHTLPQDRVSFSYNHFHNAIQTDEFLLPSTDANGFTTNLDVQRRRNIQSVNRFTLGVEKTFESGQSSIEFRLPLIGQLQNGAGFDEVSDGGNVGNFSIILKRLFFTTDNFAVAAGLGLNLPTGSDARGSIGDIQWEVTNEAVHFLPYVGVAGAPSENFFYQAFAQLDAASTGNPVDVSDSFGDDRVGRLNDQTLLYLDATGGAWLYKNPASRLAGIASILELHYTTTVQDADVFGVVGGTPNSSAILFFGNQENRQDFLNGSVGLHTILRNGTSIRVGGVFPLDTRDDKRLFDAEVQASVNVPF